MIKSFFKKDSNEIELPRLKVESFELPKLKKKYRILKNAAKASYVTTFIFGFIFIYCVANILNYTIDTTKTADLSSEIKNRLNSEILAVSGYNNTVVEDADDEEIRYVEDVNAVNIDINLKDINILKSINPNAKGWVTVRGTNIDYPFVQTNDNEFYLKHDFDDKTNKNGWIFMDYRNSTENLDNNTILYGHNLKNGNMFGTLKRLQNKEWLSDYDDHVFTFYLGNDKYTAQIFSIYHIKNTSDYLKIRFNSDDDYLTFLNKLESRSVYDFKRELGVGDKILTLSTCYGMEEKFVVHAKLIKE